MGIPIEVMLTMDPNDQIYTTQSRETGEIKVVWVSEIRRSFERLPEERRATFLRTIPLDPDHVSYIEGHHGIEPEHVDRKIKDGDLDRPGLVLILTDDGEKLGVDLVDGNHTMVARHKAGLKDMTFIFVPPVVWKACVIDDIPEEAKLELMKGATRGVRVM